MAVSMTKKSGEVMDIAALLAKAQKDKGKSIGSFGGTYLDAGRIPTGLFEFDMAVGGGIPRGMCTIIFGPESSNKTNMALKAIAANQWLRPEEKNVFIAIEPFDPKWAARMGVDVDKLAVLYPSYAEEAADMAEMFLYGQDCGIVTVDSLAAMITTQEAEKSAESSNPGSSARAVTAMSKKTNLALRNAQKEGRYPTLIFINQNRFKIGVMHGDPESMPGGQAVRFQVQLWVRVYGKNVKDNSIAGDMPIAKEVSFVVKKHKVPITSANGKYTMVTHPHGNFGVGDTDDVNSVLTYLENLGQFEKLKNTYSIGGIEYPTIKAFKELFNSNKKFAQDIKQGVIDAVLGDASKVIVPDDTPDEDGVFAG